MRPLTVAIGTYAGGGGEGVYALHRDPAGAWTRGEVYPGALNASFGVHASRFGLHYLVDERDTGAIGAYRHGAAGWERLASVPVEGDAPCHVALNHAQTLLAVANYGSGSVSVFRLDDAGLPISPPQVGVNTGSGPNSDRQEAPHAHWVGFGHDDRWLYQTDLGTDQVLAFPIASGRIGEAIAAHAAAPGSGPRHMAFHPHLRGIAYLACELSSSITTLAIDGGTIDAHATLSTLPAGWRGANILAHVETNRAGDRLYVSNRGHDSIAVFALDAAGTPSPLGHIETGARSPRHFRLLDDDRCMIVAHERDQVVTILSVDATDMPTLTDNRIAVPGAAFVLASD